MNEEEATEEEYGGTNTVMVNCVQHPAPVSSVESEGAATITRRAPAEDNTGAHKDD